MRLEGQTILITGGCSGLGLAAAFQFKKCGCNVIIVDRDYDKGAAVASELGALFIRADVTNGAEVKAAYDKAIAKFSHI